MDNKITLKTFLENIKDDRKWKSSIQTMSFTEGNLFTGKLFPKPNLLACFLTYLTSKLYISMC